MASLKTTALSLLATCGIAATLSSSAWAQNDDDPEGTVINTTTVDSQPVDYKTRTVDDNLLPYGVTVTVQDGKKGTKETVEEEREFIVGGEKKIVKEKHSFISEAPVEKVVRKGTNTKSKIAGIDAEIAKKESKKITEINRKQAEERAKKLEEEREKAKQRAYEAAQRDLTTSSSTHGTGSSRTSEGQKIVVDVSAAGMTTPAENQKFLKSIVSGEEYRCANEVIMRESGFQTDATNPSSGAYGVAQALPAGKYASHGSDWRTNGKVQILWMKDYVNTRYGGFCGALAWHDSHNWY